MDLIRRRRSVTRKAPGSSCRACCRAPWLSARISNMRDAGSPRQARNSGRHAARPSTLARKLSSRIRRVRSHPSSRSRDPPDTDGRLRRSIARSSAGRRRRRCRGTSPRSRRRAAATRSRRRGRGLTPDLVTGQLHGAVPDPADGQALADRDRSGTERRARDMKAPNSTCPWLAPGGRWSVPAREYPLLGSADRALSTVAGARCAGR